MALEALYLATDGGYWADNTNWLSDRPLHEWAGVSTDGAGRVIGLDLAMNRLAGAIPPQIRWLSNLTSLSLRGNRLSGEIPADLGTLANLTELYLSSNQLAGCIPTALSKVASNDLEELSLPFCTDTGQQLLDRYDANGNGTIERDEVIAAIAEYLAGAIDRDEAVAVLTLYLSP